MASGRRGNIPGGPGGLVVVIGSLQR
jgi:hypothetical protein